MSCHRLKSDARPAPWWHRLYCARCRDARAVDAMLAFGVEKLRDAQGDFGLMQRAREVLDVDALGKASRRMAWGIGLRKVQRRAAKFGVFALAVGGYSYYISLTPPLNIPPRVFPQPNAYDYFRKAVTQLTHEKLKEIAVTSATAVPLQNVSAEERQQYIRQHVLEELKNMSGGGKAKVVWTSDTTGYINNGSTTTKLKIVLAKGTSGFANDGRTITITMDKTQYRSHPASDLERKRVLVARNAAALATMREGLSYPYNEVYIRAFSTPFPNYAGYREMARLLAQDAQVKESEGDTNAAVKDCLDAMEMGQKCAHGGPLIGALVGIACQAIGRQPLWKLIPKLDATQAKAALQRMQAIETAHVPFADVMQEEHWLGEMGLHDILRQPFWRFQEYGTFFGYTNGESGAPGWGQRLMVGTYLMAYSNRHIWNNYTRYADESVSRARMSYPDAMAQPSMPEPDDPICKVLFPIFAQAQFKDVQSETQNGLLLTALALRAYATEHNGQVPGTLDALVPGYLSAVPQDLFARHAPLRYVANNDGTYRLYSIGPDGNDDGGRAVDNALHPSPSLKAANVGVDSKASNRYTIMPDSLGDIVAGITDLPNPLTPKHEE